MRCHPIGDRAIHVQPAPRGPVDRLRNIAGVEDVVAAFDAITVFYDPARTNGIDQLAREIAASLTQADAASGQSVLHTIPVCYDLDFGLDLLELAERLRLPAGKIIEMHAATEYTVAAVGFMPGFGYLTGLPASLQVERRTTPRTSVPGGSVGIASDYTGIYPRSSPGGWHIIGRTPLVMFDPSQPTAASRLCRGDCVRFEPIARGEFERWK
jgi:KipI family sensor histidine kinase inhibitor